MRKTTAAVCAAATLTFAPVATTFAENASAPAPQQETNNDDGDDKTGLWGLLGLLGLAGLAGLKRRDRDEHHGTTTRTSGATDVNR